MRRILDPNFQYTPSAQTNVADTLRKLGFEPPSEDKRHQQKWEMYRSLGLRDLVGGAK